MTSRWLTEPLSEYVRDYASCTARCPRLDGCANECTRSVEAGYRGLPRNVAFPASAEGAPYSTSVETRTCQSEAFTPYRKIGPNISDLQMLTNEVSK
jgi:hypothetical protein